MPPRRSSQQPPPLEVKNFMPDEIEAGIVKLKRRVDEVKALQAENVQHDDQRVENAQQNISRTVLEVFGPNSPEFRQHQHHRIWRGAMTMMMSGPQRTKAVQEGCVDTTVMLEGLIAALEEKRADHQQDPQARTREVFRGLPVHPRIANACTDTFMDGHYREAVLNASIALVNYVKERSGRHDLDGAPLIRAVFSKNAPVLAFNDLKDQTDIDEQEGLMHLFEGAVMALRNPRAHDTVPDTSEVAVEYLSLLSLLAKRLDATKKRKP